MVLSYEQWLIWSTISLLGRYLLWLAWKKIVIDDRILLYYWFWARVWIRNEVECILKGPFFFSEFLLLIILLSAMV